MILIIGVVYDENDLKHFAHAEIENCRKSTTATRCSKTEEKSPNGVLSDKPTSLA